MILAQISADSDGQSGQIVPFDTNTPLFKCKSDIRKRLSTACVGFKLKRVEGYVDG